MTKKDYELIAHELKFQHELLGYNNGQIEANGENDSATVYVMSCRLWAQTLLSVNPKFNTMRFLTACGIKRDSTNHMWVEA